MTAPAVMPFHGDDSLLPYSSTTEIKHRSFLGDINNTGGSGDSTISDEGSGEGYGNGDNNCKQPPKKSKPKQESKAPKQLPSPL